MLFLIMATGALAQRRPLDLHWTPAPYPCGYDQAADPPDGLTAQQDLNTAKDICLNADVYLGRELARDIVYVTVSNQSVLNVTVPGPIQRAIAGNSALAKQFMLSLHRLFQYAIQLQMGLPSARTVNVVMKVNLYVEGSEFKIADAETDDAAENKVRIRLVIP
jgi:hypothetical protein